ncbi:MAG: aminoglycoside phosphotransferase family protein [Candidatus Yanofskybacteria bacterium]|nr:aminoglycoside phosphotransferase family protein [Candidatus Yanofskybacteria bacterium]
MSDREKKKVEDITIGGKSFAYVKDRLIGGRVFVNQERSEYLRTANSAEIAGEINLTEDLYERGFPVPEVVAKGTLENDTAYYIEKSIGERVFGDIFMEETRAQGQVSSESFEAFVEVIKKYSAAQFDPKNFVPRDKDSLAGITALANVMRNNPPPPEMQPMFTEAYEKATERICALPWGYIQADLNAFNILHDGIIDFELAGFGPVGYDVLTNVHFGRMWPKDRVAYRFSEEQVAKYIGAVDIIAQENNLLPAISSYANDFLVLKAIWASGKDKESEDNPESNPDFWKWRVNMRDWCIRQYLKGESIDSNQFEEAGTNEKL